MPPELSRRELDELEEFAKQWGAKGLAYLVYDADGEVRSPIAKFLSEPELEAFRSEPGTTVLFAAGTWELTSRVLGALRLELANRLDLIDESEQAWLWVTDFPMFEWDEDEQRWGAKHHPFTRPAPDWVDRFDEDPAHAIAHAYDLIGNGNELGGGSFRIHEADLQARAFALLNLTPEQQRDEVRLPARRARDGCAATRRDRVRDRPHGDGARGRAEPPRRDRVPEEPGGPRPDVRRPDRGRAGPAEGARSRRRRRRRARSPRT